MLQSFSTSSWSGRTNSFKTHDLVFRILVCDAFVVPNAHHVILSSHPNYCVANCFTHHEHCFFTSMSLANYLIHDFIKQWVQFSFAQSIEELGCFFNRRSWIQRTIPFGSF